MRAPIIAVLALAAFATGCQRSDSGGVLPGEALEERPTQESWGVVLTIAQDGLPRARMAAPYVARFERADSTYTLFQPEAPGDTVRVSVRLFDELGLPSASVRANRIVYFDKERRFTAQGRVVVISETGRRLEGEVLNWDEAERTIRSDGFVRITTPTERLQGYRLVADEALDTYSLARITGQVTVEDEF
jgi:LPS export ABC transporter protein LptC